jgi:hypothetical protein
MVFLRGTGGEEKTLGHVQHGRFSLDDTCLHVISVGGLGIRMLTLDEDLGLQVPMVLEHDYIPHTYKIVGTQFCDTLSHPSFRTFVLLELTTLI